MTANHQGFSAGRVSHTDLARQVLPAFCTDWDDQGVQHGAAWRPDRPSTASRRPDRPSALAVTPQYKCHKGNLGWEGLPTIFTASQECAWLTRCSMKGWSHHPPFDCVCFCSTSITTSCYSPQEPSRIPNSSPQNQQHHQESRTLWIPENKTAKKSD